MCSIGVLSVIFASLESGLPKEVVRGDWNRGCLHGEYVFEDTAKINLIVKIRSFF